MPLYIMYFNLKDGVSEEEFINKYLDYLQGKVEGLGSVKLHRHHFFGANPRTYQMHSEFKDLGTWDRYLTLNEKDAKFARLSQEWHSFIDMRTHYDEFIRELL